VALNTSNFYSFNGKLYCRAHLPIYKSTAVVDEYFMCHEKHAQKIASYGHSSSEGWANRQRDTVSTSSQPNDLFICIDRQSQSLLNKTDRERGLYENIPCDQGFDVVMSNHKYTQEMIDLYGTFEKFMCKEGYKLQGDKNDVVDNN